MKNINNKTPINSNVKNIKTENFKIVLTLDWLKWFLSDLYK